MTPGRPYRLIRVTVVIVTGITLTATATVTGAALAVAIAGAWFLDTPFTEGFTAVWRHPFKAGAYGAVIGMLGIPSRKTLA